MNVSMEMPLSAGGNRIVCNWKAVFINKEKIRHRDIRYSRVKELSPSGSFQVLTGNGKK